MKKISTLALALGISTIGGLVLTQTANADDSKNTEARVTVEAGDLTLTSVNDINFETKKISGEDITIQAVDSEISIQDLRGSSNKGWTLTAKLKEGDFNGLGLKFSPKITSNEKVAIATETGYLNVGGQQVASVSDESIVETEFDTVLNLKPSLNIPAKTKANTYTTTIVWNLASTPETR